MSDFLALQEYVVESISRPIKYIIYKLMEFIRVVDKFVFRQVPTGAASGYATIEQIEGNTVAWNQLVQNGNFLDGTNEWTASNNASISVTNGIMQVLRTAGGSAAVGRQEIPIYSTHIYFLKATARTSNVSHAAFLNFGRFDSLNSNDSLEFNTLNFETKSMLTTPTESSNRIILRSATSTAPTGTYAEFKECIVIDLTAIFGSGNEPTTVADFEAWLAQNIGTLPYYDYNAGELLSVKMNGMQTEDSSQQTLDTLPFDVTTITGINTTTNVRETIFPQGMKQADRAGTVKDELDLLSGTATVNVGSRAYQSDDESDPDVLTDGTTTYYALTTPIEYTDLQDANGNPLNPRYKVEQGGTEQVLPVNTSTPTTVAPTLSTIYKKNN